MFHRNYLVGILLMSAGLGLAHAQSSVTLFGKIDSGYIKKIGDPNKILDEGAQSRFGLRGTEDLGGGLSAFFWLENRFKSDTGAQNGVRFLNGQSIVGLRGLWGSVALGRDYIAGYVDVQLSSDPFIHTGISSMVQAANGGVGTVRNDGAITYQYRDENFFFSAQRANANEPLSTVLPAPSTAHHPVGLAVAYTFGKISAGNSYENPGGVNDKWQFATVRGPVGPATLSAGFGTGTANNNNERRSFVLGLSLPTTTGRFKLAYGKLKNNTTGVDIMSKLAVGYNYDLSKRTFLYANAARDQAVALSKGGFELGIQHNF